MSGASRARTKKGKPILQEQAVVRQLIEARSLRAPYAGLARSLVADALGSYVPETGAIVEIGAGTGQLRDWIKPAIRRRVVHTEPLKLALAHLQRAHPDAEARRARAEALPFADAELSAILGLCVLDVVSDVAAIAREAARVLKPGGHFVHFADLATELAQAVERLAAVGMVPLPNVFSDSHGGPWPEDVFVAPRAELEQILGLLRARRHPLARPFGQYLALFAATPLPVRRISTEYKQLSADFRHRGLLKELFRTAHDLADAAQRAEFSRYQGTTFSSAEQLAGRLSGAFSREAGFEVVESRLRNAAEIVPRLDGPRYRSLSVGEARSLGDVPDTRLVAAGPNPADDEALLELGLFVFAAKRI